MSIAAVSFPDGRRAPVLGQGTWQMGEDSRKRAEETAAIRAGVACGMTLIDTAEMYGDGASETFLGDALSVLRDEVFLVSKVLPHHGRRADVVAACERSLKRLRTDALDLYLLHWPGSVPLAETLWGFEALMTAGKIRAWGVSNFDTGDMDALVEAGGGACATDQILFNLGRRGCEHDLMPWLAGRKMPAMAYSPVEQGRLLGHPVLVDVARRLGATSAQVALAWVIGHDGVVAIPKAGTVDHVRENAAAAELVLGSDDLAALDAAFPKPRGKVPLAIL